MSSRDSATLFGDPVFKLKRTSFRHTAAPLADFDRFLSDHFLREEGGRTIQTTLTIK